MECVSLTGVQLGPRSQAAIDEIRRKRGLAAALQAMIPLGTMSSIFLGNDVLKTAYSIYSTDFEMMARASAGVPAIERAVVVRIASMAALDKRGPESRIWQEVVRVVQVGCLRRD